MKAPRPTSEHPSLELLHAEAVNVFASTPSPAFAALAMLDARIDFTSQARAEVAA